MWVAHFPDSETDVWIFANMGVGVGSYFMAPGSVEPMS